MTRLALALALCAAPVAAMADSVVLRNDLPPPHIAYVYISLDHVWTDDVDFLTKDPVDKPRNYQYKWPLYTAPDGSDSGDATRDCPARTDARVLELCDATFCGVVRLPASSTRRDCAVPTS